MLRKVQKKKKKKRYLAKVKYKRDLEHYKKRNLLCKRKIPLGWNEWHSSSEGKYGTSFGMKRKIKATYSRSTNYSDLTSCISIYIHIYTL